MGYIYQTLTKQAAMDKEAISRELYLKALINRFANGLGFGRGDAIQYAQNLMRLPNTPNPAKASQNILRGRILNETSHHSPASLQNYLTRLLSSANAGQANIYEYVKGLRNRVGEAGSLARMYQDPRKPRNWIRHLLTSGRGFWSY